jgi:membrane-bound lytic murein transglycosylase A
VSESERGAKAEAYTHLRKTATGTEPYATREEIEEGALARQGLELVWLEDAVDAFFLHVQGSGLIAFADGTTARITYDGKNGHPYTSVGRHLIDAGLFPADQMSLQALKDWLRANGSRGIAAMRQNKSYVFFRELTGEAAKSALGAMEIPLSDHRSLAVDTRFHALGTPVFVVSPALTHAGRDDGFYRLMVAQDVGSAIRGPERGDIYFGTGDDAGRDAGITKHPGNFFVLLPGAVS